MSKIIHNWYFIVYLIVSVSTISASEIVDTESTSSVLLGSGYDPLTKVFLDTCVDGTSSADNTTSSPGFSGVTYSIQSVENRSDLEKKISTGGGGKFLGNSGKAKFTRDISLNKYSIYVLVKIDVKNAATTLSKFRIQKDILDILKDDTKRFREICGDSFVLSTFAGGELYGLVTISTTTETEKKTASGSVSGSIGKFSGSAQYSKSLKTLVENKNTKVDVFLSGSSGTQSFPTDTATLLEFAKSFPGQVHSSPHVYQVDVRRYRIIRNFPKEIPPFLISAKIDILDRLNTARLSSREQIDNLEYVLGNPSQFINPNIDSLNQQLSEFEGILDNVNSSASLCLSNISNCKYKSEAIRKAKLPERKDENCVLKADSKCGVLEYAMEKSKWCGVKKYNVGNGPICGSETYVSKRSPVCGIETYASKRNEVCGLEPENQEFIRRPTSAQTIAIDAAFIAERNRRVNAGEPYNHDALYDSMLLDYCRSVDLGFSTRWRTCYLPKECRHPENGAETYNLCSHPDHGVASYLNCEDKSFGIAEYLPCRNENHKPEKFKECLIDVKTGTACK